MTTRRDEATFELLEGPPIAIVSHGERISLGEGDKAARQPIPPLVPRPRPVQPVGREPHRREPGPAANHAH